MGPQVLDANQPDRFYRGGRRIAAFRGVPATDRNVPEDWVASATTLFGEDELGLSRLPDGELFRDAVGRHPEAWLGPEHVSVFGANTALLVKLLDAGQRLPVHAHPDVPFSGEHLGLANGKTEAWVFLEPATVHLAFSREVSEEELARWVEEQDVSAMLGAMHTLRVDPGDAVLVPAGMPHAIGEGAFLVELQEPTDLSILMEWTGFDIDGAELGHLGLGFDMALRAVDRRGWSVEQVETLRGARADDIGDLLPEAAQFFRVERTRGAARWDAEFAVLVVVAGDGRLVTEAGGDLPVRAGQTLVIPFGAGRCELEGDLLEVLRCRPPAAS
ncbi:class I mannose-6-phosphate isomerase [Georgenia sp. AZ-5]|uniref:class I mannose-6-phosphate isomerase n=1 Tax=Georgenia sp. AZ-5 TaxID=3367526 RepID=UPI00375439A3